MGPRSAATVGALLGAAVGLGASHLWTARDDPARPVAAPEPQASPSAPADESAGLRAERDALRHQVARLEALLEQAQAERDGAAAPDDTEAPDAEAERRAALESAGWLPLEIDRLRAAYEAFELERLYLRDQATREGWRGSPRFRDEQRALLDALRDELGEVDFDAALYARGRNNRVQVQSLLDTSPAEDAGIRVGDEILRYAGERIYDPMSLVRLTTQGEPGRPVELRVLRNGEEIRLFVPRGPLGARLHAVSRPPFDRP